MSELIRREDVQREIQAMFDSGAFSWQEGQNLMDRINALPAASPWHRVEDELPEKNGAYVTCWLYSEQCYWEKAIFWDGKWKLSNGNGLMEPDYWMPIEPPKED